MANEENPEDGEKLKPKLRKNSQLKGRFTEAGGNAQVVAEVPAVDDSRVQPLRVGHDHFVGLLRDHTRGLAVLRVD